MRFTEDIAIHIVIQVSRSTTEYRLVNWEKGGRKGSYETTWSDECGQFKIQGWVYKVIEIVNKHATLIDWHRVEKVRFDRCNLQAKKKLKWSLA